MLEILGWVSSLFSPATKILENIHTSDKDLLTLRNELAKIEAEVQTKLIGLEQEKIKLMEVEATSSNWLSASWRPIASLVVIGIILAASFGLAHPNEKFYELAQYLLVGYVGGRSLEKSAGALGTVVSKIVKK